MIIVNIATEKKEKAISSY